MCSKILCGVNGLTYCNWYVFSWFTAHNIRT
jgi:hypothetical protein